MAIIMAAVLLLIFLGLLSSCKTKEEAVTEVFVHDTVYVHHSDTVIDVRFQKSSDTLRQVIEKVVVLRDNGDTLKTIVNNKEFKYVEVRDSASKYVARIDSLLKSLDSMYNESVVKSKRRLGIAQWEVICLIILLSPFLMNLIKRIM